ncbi:hypothetical protein N007_18615 [Alicyclobacillus acidoterrestris ATCC 49025]|nr:hypothetical protein N007_18615 [Alicyclobacillus acidoterrestris ATCC 49025]
MDIIEMNGMVITHTKISMEKLQVMTGLRFTAQGHKNIKVTPQQALLLIPNKKVIITL